MLQRFKRLCLLWGLLFFLYVFSYSQPVTTPATLNVHLGREISPFKPIRAWFVHDEPDYTCLKIGQKLLTTSYGIPSLKIRTAYACTSNGLACALLLNWVATA